MLNLKITYSEAIKLLDLLLVEIGDDEKHQFIDLLDKFDILIQSYESDNFAEPLCNSKEVLRFLMQQHNLRQVDLSEIGSQGVISEILNGKRRLNLRQISLLSKRFNVSPLTFFSGD